MQLQEQLLQPAAAQAHDPLLPAHQQYHQHPPSRGLALGCTLLLQLSLQVLQARLHPLQHLLEVGRMAAQACQQCQPQLVPVHPPCR
jgi:hypothetical protein